MSIARLAVLSLTVLAAARPALAQSGAFVIRLGRDTSAVERFTRTATRIEVDAVVRAPRTTQRHFVVEFGPTGNLTRIEGLDTRPGAPASTPPIQRGVITFARDSATAVTTRDTAVQRRTIAVPANAIPVFGGAGASWIGYELVVARLRQSRSDSIAVPILQVGGAAMRTWNVKSMGRDSVSIYDGNNTFHVRVDRDGRVLGATPVSGTQQFTVERVASADINALGAAFASRDTQQQGLGALSTRDTVRASVGGATLWIDYGRPAKRGRVLFGSTIVPYGEVWRTGANAATQMRTDRALEIGGVVVPAGFYTLWTVPAPSGGWKLLINSQTGQWGTAHDASRDIFQLPMTTTTLPQPVERFVISVAPSGQGGTLNLDWDTIRASIPFTVR